MQLKSHPYKMVPELAIDLINKLPWQSDRSIKIDSRLSIVLHFYQSYIHPYVRIPTPQMQGALPCLWCTSCVQRRAAAFPRNHNCPECDGRHHRRLHQDNHGPVQQTGCHQCNRNFEEKFAGNGAQCYSTNWRGSQQ